MAAGAAELRKTLAKDLLADLDDLDRPALVYRLGNLTNELRERAKWEALRAHDAWRRAEVEAWAAHEQALLDARSELTRKHETEVCQGLAAALLPLPLRAAGNALLSKAALLTRHDGPPVACPFCSCPSRARRGSGAWLMRWGRRRCS